MSRLKFEMMRSTYNKLNKPLETIKEIKSKINSRTRYRDMIKLKHDSSYHIHAYLTYLFMLNIYLSKLGADGNIKTQ